MAFMNVYMVSSTERVQDILKNMKPLHNDVSSTSNFTPSLRI